ncbi:hypothetical protein LEN26_017592 [Aphanomyces euteiches]|nr:hypothetical protein LEN26_017592 [Aphanomyces euteiches]KAH9105991.1 hypothetical protein AeMF1_018286 [Aphanomyces euteiches]KAH9196979.1 hypothetical protein AeNC1_001058 [Aphanomyces euteiches]
MASVALLTRFKRQSMRVGLILALSSVAMLAVLAHTTHGLPLRHLTSSIACTTDVDCEVYGSKRRPHVCLENACKPQPLFPIDGYDLIGTVSAFLCVVISSGGGLGGGGLLVPLYIIVLCLSSHDAIPLSKATIFGSVLASCLLTVRKKHPLVADRQLIDYEVMVMMEPMTLAGTIIGVNLNKMCPEWIITVLLVLLLSKTSQRMISKGRSTWKQEEAKDRAIMASVVQQWMDVVHAKKYSPAVVACAKKWRAAVKAPPLKSEPPQAVIKMTSFHETDTEDTDFSDDDCLIQPGAKAFDTQLGRALANLDELKAYKQSIPWSDMSVLFVAWIGLLLYSMVRGGHGTPSIIGLTCGSVAYWGLTVLAFPFFACVTSYFGFRILHRHELMQSCGMTYLPGDIQWNRRTTILYPALCTIAGIAAGLLGIGGGMVKGPLLLEIGLHPLVASATSTAMILFTSSATTFQFIVFGMLPYDYAIWYGLVGFVGGFVGQVGVSYLIRKYRKMALVMFLIAVVVCTSGVVMGVLGLLDIMNNGFRGFRSLCIAV